MWTVMLSPFAATVIFAIGCLAGYQYRRTWRRGGSRWRLWLFGTAAAAALLTVAFIPLTATG